MKKTNGPWSAKIQRYCSAAQRPGPKPRNQTFAWQQNLLMQLLLLLAFLGAPSVNAQQMVSQSTHLKLFSECFVDRTSDASERTRIARLIADPPCFSFCLLTNTRGYLSFIFFPQHFADDLRNCYYSQTAIRGAMRMYNAEHGIPLRRITSSLINSPDSPLIPDYLKHPFPKPSPQCRYESNGDLVSGDLLIYCTYHGAPAGNQNLSEDNRLNSGQ